MCVCLSWYLYICDMSETNVSCGNALDKQHLKPVAVATAISSCRRDSRRRRGAFSRSESNIPIFFCRDNLYFEIMYRITFEMIRTSAGTLSQSLRLKFMVHFIKTRNFWYFRLYRRKNRLNKNHFRSEWNID